MLKTTLPSALAEDFRAKLRPEAELLLCCARLELQPGERRRILRLLESEPDWAYLLDLASRHGLRPLLYRHLNAVAAATLPKAVFAGMWGWYESNSRRNQAMAAELLRILALLDANGIPALPYKGPALAASIYGDTALREFNDLDLLLRQQDVLPARALLRALGYQPKYALKPAVEAAFLRSTGQYHLVLLHDRSAVMLELHWATDPDYPVEAIGDQQWWARPGAAMLGGEEVRCFAPDELLLVLCLHGSRHHWASLGWLVDVAELLRQHPRIDWDWIMRAAQGLSCERRLALSLHLAHRLLDAPLPAQIRGLIAADANSLRLAADMAAALFDPEFREMNAFARLALNLRLYQRRRQQLRHCVHNLLAPSLVEWSQWPLPRPLFFLYVPMRLLRLAKKYGSMMLARH